MKTPKHENKIKKHKNIKSKHKLNHKYATKYK